VLRPNGRVGMVYTIWLMRNRFTVDRSFGIRPTIAHAGPKFVVK
jgi:hypothetical protein